MANKKEDDPRGARFVDQENGRQGRVIFLDPAHWDALVRLATIEEMDLGEYIYRTISRYERNS